jgi:hypothetical protein
MRHAADPPRGNQLEVALRAEIALDQEAAALRGHWGLSLSPKPAPVYFDFAYWDPRSRRK